MTFNAAANWCKGSSASLLTILSSPGGNVSRFTDYYTGLSSFINLSRLWHSRRSHELKRLAFVTYVITTHHYSE